MSSSLAGVEWERLADRAVVQWRTPLSGKTAEFGHHQALDALMIARQRLAMVEALAIEIGTALEDPEISRQLPAPILGLLRRATALRTK